MNNIDQAFAEFFEFPEGSDGKSVSTVSAKLFARLFAENALGEIDKLWEVISTQRSLEAQNQSEINDLEVRAVMAERERDQALASHDAAIKNWMAASKERDQLKAQVITMRAAGLQLLGDYGIAIENVMDDWTEEEVQDAWEARDYLRSAFEGEPEQSLADHDADVIDQARQSASYRVQVIGLAAEYDSLLADRANKLRHRAKGPAK